MEEKRFKTQLKKNTRQENKGTKHKCFFREKKYITYLKKYLYIFKLKN